METKAVRYENMRDKIIRTSIEGSKDGENLAR
jgi:hypothetical protein